jgi:hypothetical protein
MLPVSHASWTPSVLQTKTGFWSGMHPPSTQTRSVGQAASPAPHGVTQCWSTHVVSPVHAAPASALPQGVGLPVQTPFVVHE